MAGNYSSIPTWQKWALYIVIGGILYYLVYHFVIAKNGGGYNYSMPSQSSSSGQTSTPSGNGY